jgi:antitoxin component YwqK of YwqJK toxin-antitoxin module
LAQTDFNIGQITVINLGDGRLLFRTVEDEKPIEGERRIIDGRNSEYRLAQFTNGMYDGKFEHHRSNRLIESGTFKEGVRHGVFTDYFYDGSVKSQRPFTDGKLDGVVKSFYTNGKLESQKEYKNGVEHGIEQKWDSQTGEMTVDARFVNGKPDGTQTRHISSNAGDYVEVSHWANGAQNGNFSQTFANGQPRVQGKYLNGKRDGVWIEYRRNGQPEKSSTYRNGELNGELTTFFTDGTVEKIETYAAGKREGPAKEYFFDSGKLKAEYNFANNAREGKYKIYYDSGSVREEGNYEKGNEVYRKEYYENGRVHQIRQRNARGQWETLESNNIDGTIKR